MEVFEALAAASADYRSEMLLCRAESRAKMSSRQAQVENNRQRSCAAPYRSWPLPQP